MAAKKDVHASDAQLVLRVPSNFLRRADALRPKLAQNPGLLMVGRVTRSAVMRLALARGLAELEREYSPAPGVGVRAPKTER